MTSNSVARERIVARRRTYSPVGACLLSLLLLLLLSPFVGSSRGSPGQWVSVDVDGILRVNQYSGVSYDVESSGVAHVAYYSWDHPSNEAIAKYAVANGSDVSVMTLGRFSGSSQIVSDTRVDALGRAHILLEIQRYIGEQTFVNCLEYYVLSSEQIVADTNLTPILGLNLQYSEFSLAVDGSGHAHIGLIDFYHNLYYVSDSGGTWTSALIGPVGNYGGGVSIAVDALDAVHMSYVNGTGDYNLTYVTNAGGSWVTTDVLVGNVFPDTTSIALDHAGHVFIGCLPYSVDNQYSGNLGYATNLNGTFEIFRTPFTGTLSSSRWLSINRDGDVMMVYNMTRVSIGSVLSNGDWITETFPGGGFVVEDAQGFLHTFYLTSIWEWYDLWLKYASNRFERSAAPTGIGVTAEPGRAALRWTAPVDTGGLPVIKYYIYYGPDRSDSTYIATVGPSVVSYTIADLSSTKYYFRVAPVTAAGIGANSSIVDVTPSAVPALEPPPKPTDHTMAVIGASIAVAATLGILSLAYLRKTARFRLFTVVFTCWAIALTSILPAYFADASWNSTPDKWTITTVYSSPKWWYGQDSSVFLLDSHGFGHIVTVGGGTLQYMTNASGVWSTETVDPSVHASYPSMALESDGSVHVAYINYSSYSEDLSELRYATNEGGAWTITVVDRCSPYICPIAAGPDGVVHIGYVNNSYYHELKLASSDSGGWGIETIEKNPLSLFWFGDIEVSDTGQLRLAYSKEYDVRYAVNSSGGWNITTVGSGFAPSLWVDGNGFARVAYRVDTNGLSQLVYSEETADGWIEQELGFRTGLYFRMAPGREAGHFVVVYRNESETSIMLAEGEFGNFTETVVTETVGQGFSVFPPAMAVSSSGEPVICVIVTDNSIGEKRMELIERDLSPFTLSERTAKGWAPTQANILGAWMALEVLTGLVFLGTWGGHLWRRSVDKGKTAGNDSPPGPE